MTQSALVANSVVFAERRFGPETTTFDSKARQCLCGAAPLITEANGGFYLSCPPCWARTHTVASEKLARQQWNAMLASIRRFS